MSVSGQTGSVHAMILLGAGLFSDLKPELARDVPVSVALEVEEEGHSGGREVRIVEERLKVSRLATGGNATAVDFKTVLDPVQLAELGAGRLRMTVSRQGNPKYSASAMVRREKRTRIK